MDVASIFPTVFEIFDLAGVVVAGILGGMVAREMRLDIVGFMALAVMSALGGGMIRDTLLQMGPPVALTNPSYLPCAFAGAIVAFFFAGERLGLHNTAGIEAVRQLGVTRVFVAGLSMGGALTLNLAARYPEIVKGIVPINAAARVMLERGIGLSRNAGWARFYYDMAARAGHPQAREALRRIGQ